jgi:hypothetical protein
LLSKEGSTMSLNAGEHRFTMREESTLAGLNYERGKSRKTNGGFGARSAISQAPCQKIEIRSEAMVGKAGRDI